MPVAQVVGEGLHVAGQIEQRRLQRLHHARQRAGLIEGCGAGPPQCLSAGETEALQSPGGGQRRQLLFVQPRASGQVFHGDIRASRLSLGDDAFRQLLPDPADAGEAEPDGEVSVATMLCAQVGSIHVERRHRGLLGLAAGVEAGGRPTTVERFQVGIHC